MRQTKAANPGSPYCILRRISHKFVGPGFGLDRISHIAYVYAAGDHRLSMYARPYPTFLPGSVFSSDCVCLPDCPFCEFPFILSSAGRQSVILCMCQWVCLTVQLSALQISLSTFLYFHVYTFLWLFDLDFPSLNLSVGQHVQYVLCACCHPHSCHTHDWPV